MKETPAMIEQSIAIIQERIEAYLYKNDLTDLERKELDYLIELLRQLEQKLHILKNL